MSIMQEGRKETGRACGAWKGKFWMEEVPGGVVVRMEDIFCETMKKGLALSGAYCLVQVAFTGKRLNG